MAKQNTRLDSAEMQGSGVVTPDLLDRIKRKNKRAGNRMARRYMRKVSARIPQDQKFTPLELALSRLANLPSRYRLNRRQKRLRESLGFV